MKATITARGDLFVIAETEMESYALSCWWNAYNLPPKGEGRPVFGVKMFEPPCAMNEGQS